MNDHPEWWPYEKPYAIMDCLEGMKELPDKCVDLVLTDPPYGLDVVNMNMGVGKGKKCSKINNRKWEKKDWDIQAPSKEYFDEIFRISKNQIIFGGNYFELPVCYGYVLWDKEIPEGLSFSDCEMAWHSFKKAPRIFRYSAYHEKNEKYHPTQKPIPLFIWILENYSKPGDIVLDPFLGSGTTLRACRETGRVGLGFEIEKDYEPVIRKRMMADIPKLEEWF